MTSGSAHGVLFDVDGVLRWTSLRRTLGRIRSLRTTSPLDRRSGLAIPGLVRTLAADLDKAPVYYLTAFSPLMTRPITEVLARDGYPRGTVLTTGRRLVPRWLVEGGGADRKRAALDELVAGMPDTRWVLLGDDGGIDPRLFVDLALRHRDRVAVIGLRQVYDVDRPKVDVPAREQAVVDELVVGAPNGEELLPLVRSRLGIGPPRTGSLADWLLTAQQRRNGATGLAAWTEGNTARALVHGRTYFRVLATELAAAGDGDLVRFADWRADADELLDDDGPTIGDALSAAIARGADVRGLLWHGHTALVGSNLAPNRRTARTVNRAGGEVLLDQRVLAIGCHHQKMFVIRHAGRPADDVAFLGGIDLDHGGRDDADHHGDPQSVGADEVYGPTPAYHDVQLELRGPAVGDVEETFRERWDNPAPVVRLPWHRLAMRLAGLPRTASPLPPAWPAPAPAGTCAVQILRTYPRRRPRYPYAPLGERSIALGYAKALSRAQALVYIEDQYLWSFDVARMFAAALKRSSRLHLIAVVPRRPDNENPLYNESAMIGHAEALSMVQEAGGDRVQILDVENLAGRPVYVHAKVCVIDDVWAAVGSDNFNTRSWTHDSELTAAVVDSARDPREPADPGGLGDGARRFARELRLELLREHLGLDTDDDLLDPLRAAEAARRGAAELDAWHDAGRPGPRPRGRLRRHPGGYEGTLPARHRWFTAPIYRSFLDPDGRPLDMRLRRTY